MVLQTALIDDNKNTWMGQILDFEAMQPGFTARYRNPSRATKESLAVADQSGSGEWKAMRFDFIIFGINHGGEDVTDLIDLHGHHLSDACPSCVDWPTSRKGSGRIVDGSSPWRKLDRQH